MKGLRVRPTSRACVLLVISLMVLVSAGVPVTAQNDPDQVADELTVTLDTTRADILEAERFSFTSEVTNLGVEPTVPLVAHLNVASLQEGVYVDPEDWSPERTQFIRPIAPGSSVNLSWTIQALIDGDFAVYVVVLPKDLSTSPIVSHSIQVQVGKRTILDLMDVLPVGIAVPVVLLLLFFGIRSRHRGYQVQDPEKVD